MLPAEEEGRCITKQELMKILKTMFPDNKNIKFVDGERRKKLYEVFEGAPVSAIISKLKYYDKRTGADEEVLIRCDYLTSNRKLVREDEIEILDICAGYEMRRYEYDTAIGYLERVLDINRGQLDVRDVIKRLIYIYDKQGNSEKVRYLKDIIND